jgi:DNA-binding transcriptional MocR family regulator
MMCIDAFQVKREIVMVQSDWDPALEDGPGAVWERLVAALGRDIATGTVSAGERLPPQRDLAYRLGLSVGTVSRAYAEAERRGLVASHVGRGTFVTENRGMTADHRPAMDRINLSMNVPPIGPVLGVGVRTIEELARRVDLGAVFDYTFTAGLSAVREAGAAWLREQGGVARASADRLIQTGGGQNALAIACSSFARPGDAVLCDVATYPGNRTIADHGGWHLRGVPADGRGMDPQALDRIAQESGARLLMLIPTLHNPTTLTMDSGRREEIVAVARARDLLIVEDDIYRVFGTDDEPPPFADLAPERVIHVSSMSKALSPGLRLGFILAPQDDGLFERLLLAAQATGYCPPAASGLILAGWLENGMAARILGDVRAEMARRNALARGLLGDAVAPCASQRSLHLWLPMEAERARQVYERALIANVELTPPDAPFVEGHAPSGLRVCLGQPLDASSLEQGLLALKSVLQTDHHANGRGII